MQCRSYEKPPETRSAIKWQLLKTADLLSLSKKTEPLLSQRASLTGDRQNGEENVSESEPMVLSRLTSSDSSHEPSSPSSPAEGSCCCCCCCEEESASPSLAKLWLSAETLQMMLLSASSSSSWATGWRGCGLKSMSHGCRPLHCIQNIIFISRLVRMRAQHGMDVHAPSPDTTVFHIL